MQNEWELLKLYFVMNSGRKNMNSNGPCFVGHNYSTLFVEAT